MNKQIVLNIVAKLVADYKGNGSGKIKLNNFAFAVKGEGKFSVESLNLEWDFKNVVLSKEKGNLTTSGNSTLKLVLTGLNLDHPEGTWSVGEIEINSVDELTNLSILLPLEQILDLVKA